MARIFITGSTDGLGLAAAKSLLDQGHEIVLHARTKARAADVSDLPLLGIAIGDLSSAAETKDVAAQVDAIGRMDAVIHNAGIYTSPTRAGTADGHALTLAVNTLAPFILTASMQRPDRLVYLSSGLHRGGEGSLADLDWTTRPWDAAQAYGETKLQLAALAVALSRRWPDVLSNAVDPGWVRTRMGGSSAPVDIDTGQRTQAWLAAGTDPATHVSGGYWHELKQEEPSPEVGDEAFQDGLVAQLEGLTGVRLPS